MKYPLQHYFKILQLCAISDKNYHSHYKRTVDYAQELTDIICAEDESKKRLLKLFQRRETQQEYERSLEFTHLLTRGMSNRIAAPILKGSRNDQIKPELKWKSESTGDKTVKAIDSFYGGNSLWSYINEFVLSARYSDPNAFVLMQFKPFNSDVEVASPEAVIIQSKGAVHYEYENGELDYLTVHNERFGHYTLYLPDYNIRLTLIDESAKKDHPNPVKPTVAGDIMLFDFEVLKASKEKSAVIELDGKLYKFEYTDQVKAGCVQAVRIGYILDKWTHKQTCVSIMHPAIPRIKGTLQKTRNLNLNLDLHTFNQKVQVRQRCSGDRDDKGNRTRCEDGMGVETGKNCRNCSGTGYEPIHQGPQDVLEVPMPNKMGDEFIDPSKLIHMIQPEVTSTELLWRFVKENTNEAYNDVYTSNAFSTVGTTKTATEVTANYDSIHDVVHPEFSIGQRNVFRFMVKMIATFLDELAKLESYDLLVPADLQLYTLQELIDQYKTAKDSGAPVQVLQRLREKILSIMHKDNPAQAKRDAVMLLHEPFADKTKEDIQFFKANGWLRKKDAILSAYYSEIMRDVLKENGEAFYTMKYEEQKQKIQEKLQLLMDELSEENTPVFKIEPGAAA